MKTKIIPILVIIGVCSLLIVIDIQKDNTERIEKVNVDFAHMQMENILTGEVISTSSSSSGVELFNPTIISKWKTYTDTTYKLSFNYPDTWIVADANLNGGTFQLFNYDYNKFVGKMEVFDEGTTKIEMFVTEDILSTFLEPSYDSLASDPICNYTCYKMISEGNSDNKLDKTITYIFEMPTRKGTFIFITLYGDNSLKWVLEEMVKSLRFN